MQILIIEDDVDIVTILKLALSFAKFDVITAPNGRAGLAMLETQKPDLILLDIMMPEMNGYQVCEIVRAHEDWKSIPIIFLSAKTSDEDVKKGLGLGANGYIAKPFDPNRVVGRVQKLAGFSGVTEPFHDAQLGRFI